MTTQEMARSFLRRAAAILREAERLLGDEAWNLVVRRCQEAVEFALKGALREAGVEVPKVHEVSGALRRNTRRLPAHLAAEIDLLVSASRRLREERELAFYGDEETEAEALFSREDAEDALGQHAGWWSCARQGVGASNARADQGTARVITLHEQHPPGPRHVLPAGPIRHGARRSRCPRAGSSPPGAAARRRAAPPAVSARSGAR